MKDFATIWDTVTITPASVDDFRKSVKDNIFVSTERPLRVEIVATHAGRLTRNHGFYLPQKMRDGVDSLLQNFGKPILTHHSQHDDPIGRIVAAKYIDTSLGLTRDSAVEGIFKDLCNESIPFVRAVNLIADKLADSEILRDPSYPGLGHILITAEISDEKAIKKILDKRYLTVSIGASTDKAICSICKQDWVEEGPCEHRPGREYEDKLAFIIAGKLLYDEVSFVNVPADTLARVVTIHNSAGEEPIIVEESRQICNVNASFYFTENVGGTSMSKVQEAWDNVSKLVALEDTKEEDKVKALKDFLEQFKDDEDAVVQKAKDKLAELESAKSTEPDAQIGDNAADDTQAGADGEEPDDADKHYEDMIEFGYKIALFDEDFEDAKLSSEQRKKMAKSTFCKPGERKYPVNDCNHAKVAMAYAKKNNEAASVVACIRRKAKALGCPFNGKKDAFDEWVETELAEILRDLEEREAAASGDTPADTSAQDSQTPQADTQPAQPDKQDVKAADECQSCKEAEGKIEALRQEFKDIYAEYDEMQQDHIEQLRQLKGGLADALVKLDMISGKEIESIEDAVKETAAMPLDELLKKVESLKDSLDLETVVAKVNDGMANIPEAQVDDPTLTADNAGDQDPTVQEDPFKEYREKYKKTLSKDGFKAAGAFIAKLVQAGLVPVDFDPEK